MGKLVIIVAALLCAATASAQATATPATQPMAIAAQAPQAVKLATVNTQEVFNAMPEKATAEAALKSASDKLQAELKSLQAEFNKKYADYQALANDPNTPQTIKERRMQELQENDNKIQAFQRAAENELKTKKEAMLLPINDKIAAALKTVGEDGGYTMIFDVSATPVPYRDASVEDVTAKVKAKLGIAN